MAFPKTPENENPTDDRERWAAMYGQDEYATEDFDETVLADDAEVARAAELRSEFLKTPLKDQDEYWRSLSDEDKDRLKFLGINRDFDPVQTARAIISTRHSEDRKRLFDELTEQQQREVEALGVHSPVELQADENAEHLAKVPVQRAASEVKAILTQARRGNLGRGDVFLTQADLERLEALWDAWNGSKDEQALGRALALARGAAADRDAQLEQQSQAKVVRTEHRRLAGGAYEVRTVDSAGRSTVTRYSAEDVQRAREAKSPLERPGNITLEDVSRMNMAEKTRLRRENPDLWEALKAEASESMKPRTNVVARSYGTGPR